MKKNSTINGLKVLTYIKLKQIKNQIIDIFTHPIKAIGTIMNILIPLFLMLIPIFMSINNKKAYIPPFNLPINIIGAIIMLILTIIFFINL